MQDNLLENLNAEQVKAATHDAGPLMIIAGAGTGKTTVITHRIGWLIEQKKAKADEILALTFTEKAAAEMEERVDRLLPYGYVDLWISTFHSFCERVLKAHGLDVGIPNDFKLLNQTDAWLLVRQNFDRFNLDYYRPAGNPTKFIHAMLTHFSRAKDENVSPEEYLEYVEGLTANQDRTNTTDETYDQTELSRQQELAGAYHTYQQLLLENNALDFGDLIAYTLKLFTARPKILAKYQQQFKYVLVDEFQDTNWAQYELIKMLALPQNNITVVCDDDQAIYKFRGASVSNVLQFKSDYPDAKQIALTMNYRSAQKILDASYAFIQANNPNRLETQLEGLSKRLVSGRHSVTGAPSPSDGQIEHIHASTLEDEARQTIDRIFELHQNGVSLSEFAILVRANDSALPFIQHLEMRGLPYQFMALRGLYRKPIILDTLALLHVVDQPMHSQSVYRVLSHPAIGIKPNDLIQLTHECYRRGKSLIDVMNLAMTLRGVAPETSERCAELLQTFSRLRSVAARKPVSELFVAAVKEAGLLGYVSTLSERDQQENFRLLQQLYQRMKGFESITADHSLRRFLEELEHEQASGDEGALKMDPEVGPETVKIMTIHAAKGLEFGHVFIVNLVDRRFPTSEKKDAIPLPDALIKEQLPQGDIHLEEERRLMYVALTRAKDAVYLTSADDYGGLRKKKLSRFLVEMGFERFERGQVGNQESSTQPDRKFLIPDLTPSDRYQATNAHITIPKAFSYTQLAAFETCPLQYKFAHVLHVPVFGRYQMSFGKTMHGTLQRFFEMWKERSKQPQQTLFDVGAGLPGTSKGRETPPIPVSIDELLALYADQWINEWYENDAQREDYRQRGQKSLRDYYAKIEVNHPEPLHLEKGFTVKFGDVTVRGRIDRVDAIDGGVEIIDYKTGKPKTELEAQEKRQLMIYQIAATECFNPPLVPVKLTYHYLENNSTVSFLGTPEQLDELRADIIATARAIQDSDFKATPSFKCDYCDFSSICEFRQR